MLEYIKHLFSLDELRVSSLVLCMIAGMVACIYVYIKYHIIDPNLVTLESTLILAVAGVNAVKGIVNRNNDNPPL